MARHRLLDSESTHCDLFWLTNRRLQHSQVTCLAFQLNSNFISSTVNYIKSNNNRLTSFHANLSRSCSAPISRIFSRQSGWDERRYRAYFIPPGHCGLTVRKDSLQSRWESSSPPRAGWWSIAANYRCSHYPGSPRFVLPNIIIRCAKWQVKINFKTFAPFLCLTSHWHASSESPPAHVETISRSSSAIRRVPLDVIVINCHKMFGVIGNALCTPTSKCMLLLCRLWVDWGI